MSILYDDCLLLLAWQFQIRWSELSGGGNFAQGSVLIEVLMEFKQRRDLIQVPLYVVTSDVWL